MSHPWLSVIVPTYNGAAYLDMALESIVSQRDGGIEVIAVDDGSTDDTITILNRYTHRLPLRVETCGRIGNWAANSNHGLRLARADHVCFLHQDDLWLPGRLRVLRPFLERGDPAFVLHPALFVDARGQSLGLWRCPLAAGLNKSEQVIERLLVQNFIAIPAPIFSRQAALEVGGLDEKLWYAADWDFWLKLAGRGAVYYHTKPLAAFRVHAGSQTMQGTARAAEMRRQMETVLDRHLTPWGDSRPGRTNIDRVARLSVECNHALADAAGGQGLHWRPLLRGFFDVGLSGVHRYLRDSRIVERLQARVKAGWST